jgi:hypothetical protein
MIKLAKDAWTIPQFMVKDKVYSLETDKFYLRSNKKNMQEEFFIKTKPIKIEFAKVEEKDEVYGIEVMVKDLNISNIIYTPKKLGLTKRVGIEKEIITEIAEWLIFDIMEIMLYHDRYLTLDAQEKKEKLLNLVKEIKIKYNRK